MPIPGEGPINPPEAILEDEHIRTSLTNEAMLRLIRAWIEGDVDKMVERAKLVAHLADGGDI
jgi:hypothetical protein